MGIVLLTAALLGGVDYPKSQAADLNLDGKWTIVYAEKHGQRNNSWEQQLATFQGNSLSFDEAGKQQTLQLDFGRDQTLKATLGNNAQAGKNEATAAKQHEGVYIASQDYLCISLKSAKHDGAAAAEEQEAKKDDKSSGHSSGSFILVLRRQR
jgi:hypothetical protein